MMCQEQQLEGCEAGEVGQAVPGRKLAAVLPQEAAVKGRESCSRRLRGRGRLKRAPSFQATKARTSLPCQQLTMHQLARYNACMHNQL
jgi:hypothetical protein